MSLSSQGFPGGDPEGLDPSDVIRSVQVADGKIRKAAIYEVTKGNTIPFDTIGLREQAGQVFAYFKVKLAQGTWESPDHLLAYIMRRHAPIGVKWRKFEDKYE